MLISIIVILVKLETYLQNKADCLQLDYHALQPQHVQNFLWKLPVFPWNTVLVNKTII